MIKGTRLQATVIGGAEIPNVIDELPILAVAAALVQHRLSVPVVVLAVIVRMSLVRTLVVVHQQSRRWC